MKFARYPGGPEAKLSDLVRYYQDAIALNGDVRLDEYYSAMQADTSRLKRETWQMRTYNDAMLFVIGVMAGWLLARW